MSTPAPAQPPGAGEPFHRWVELLGPLLLTSGAVTSLLYYFGYVRERELFAYFGVPVSSLDLTTTDYVVRSAQAVFVPVTSVALVAVVAVALHHVLLVRAPQDVPRGWRRGWAACAGLAAALVAVGAAGALGRPVLVGATVSALALGGGALLLGYAAWMAGLDPGLPAPVHQALGRTRAARRALVLVVALIAAFWWTTNVAHRQGQDAARAIAASLEVRGEAVVLSRERLGITGHGVTVEDLSTPDAGFAFRYTGLRVLLHAGDRWVLLPRGWTRDNGDVVVLLPDDAETLRVDVRP